MEDCKYCEKHIKGFKRVDVDELLGGGEYNGDCDLRWRGTKGVIDEIINKYENPKILDLAMGGGEDTICLLKKGCNVISNDVEEYFVPIVEKRARENNVKLEIRIEDWRNILFSNKYKEEEFDFIFILGNSFPCYIYSEEERRICLKGFWKILKSGGTLLFDTRNFDYFINNKEYILKDPENNFRYDGKCSYVNKDFKFFYTFINNEIVHFCVKCFSKKEYACKDLYLATEERVKKMIKDVLGDVELEIFYDYQKEKPEHYDFVQYKLTKS
jgi:ubiquinone/menaquinone biosynthesis C-methylase UbiE